MLVSFCELVLAIIIAVAVGVLVGKAINKDNQKKRCPYCSCKNLCRIGQGVEQKCPDEELKPFVCGGL